MIHVRFLPQNREERNLLRLAENLPRHSVYEMAVEQSRLRRERLAVELRWIVDRPWYYEALPPDD